MIADSQRGFDKGKRCLSGPIAICDETGSANKGRAVGVVYLDFSKAFDIVSHSIIVSNW